MIHFTCDRCKRVIDSEQELRYIVRMEIEAVMDPIHEEEPQDDRDHLSEIDEILERIDASDSDAISDDSITSGATICARSAIASSTPTRWPASGKRRTGV